MQRSETWPSSGSVTFGQASCAHTSSSLNSTRSLTNARNHRQHKSVSSQRIISNTTLPLCSCTRTIPRTIATISPNTRYPVYLISGETSRHSNVKTKTDTLPLAETDHSSSLVTICVSIRRRNHRWYLAPPSVYLCVSRVQQVTCTSYTGDPEEWPPKVERETLFILYPFLVTINTQLHRHPYTHSLELRANAKWAASSIIPHCIIHSLLSDKAVMCRLCYPDCRTNSSNRVREAVL